MQFLIKKILNIDKNLNKSAFVPVACPLFYQVAFMLAQNYIPLGMFSSYLPCVISLKCDHCYNSLHA